MAELQTRQRAYWGEQLVTIISQGRRTTKIRTNHGFIEEVETKDLDFNVESDGRQTLRYDPKISGP
jgi:hypothetical protein